MFSHRATTFLFASFFAISAVLVACDDGDLPSDTSTTPTGMGGDGGQGTAGGGATSKGGTGGTGGAPDCYTSPMTHEEIINACTDADKIDKQPVLPLLNPDGTLPDLP